MVKSTKQSAKKTPSSDCAIPPPIAAKDLPHLIVMARTIFQPEMVPEGPTLAVLAAHTGSAFGPKPGKPMMPGVWRAVG
jgi:hypothetical protein